LAKVKVKTVIGGLFLQLSLGIFVMKTVFGYTLFKFISDEIQKFLFFTDHGTRLVFGDKFEDHYIAFKVRYIIQFSLSLLVIPRHGTFFE
jgi:nucleoside permease NupC